MSEAIQLTEEEVTALRVKCLRSPVEFCRIFLPGWFKSKMPWVHRGLLALRAQRCDFLLDFGDERWPNDVRMSRTSAWTPDDLVKLVTNFVIETRPAVMKEGVVIQPAVVEPVFELSWDAAGTITDIRIARQRDNEAFILPRGFSKTTLINAMNLRDLAYAAEKFILFVSETAGHANNQLMTVRRQFEENTLLRLVFGDLVPDRNSSKKWKDDEIELLNDTRMEAIGTGGQVRGKSKDAQRPTRIVVDDFQDAETIRKSDTQREKDLRWFLQVLLPARDLLGPEDEAEPTRMDVVGTMPHPEAVIALLMSDVDWMPVRFGAWDRQGGLLWEWAMDAGKLAKLRATYERMGQLDVFELEYNSRALGDTGAAFPVDRIVYVLRPSEWFVAKCVMCDPAISENPDADFFALAAIGMGKHGDINVIDMMLEVGVPFDEQAERYFDFHFAHMLDLDPLYWKHGVESVAYQRALKSHIETKMHEKSKTWGQRAYFEITPVLHAKKDGSKIARVNGFLSPRVKAGKVSLARPMPSLIGQLQDWPNGKKDGPDCLAMGIQLLDPYAWLASNVANDDEEPVSALHAQTAGPLLKGRQWRKAP